MVRLLLTRIQPLFILLLFTCLGSLQGSDDSNISDIENPLTEEEEEEIKGKRAEIEMGWSVWSEWSTCSRTCDGGASFQMRRCNARQGCREEGTRYRICSMQPCPEQTDFRAQQCSAYDSVPYQDKFYEWEPHYDSQDPCSLICRAKGQNLVTQLSPKVLDGTRCREGSLDMCINGKCQPVGCDLQLGSTKKVDACGVCGGDGASCAKPSFFWEETAVTECSTTCGGGTQLVKPVCKNKKTGEEVDERLCDLSKRPPSRTRECKADKCPATYVTEEWSLCSASCDGGWQERRVTCVEVLANGTSISVNENRCSSKRKPKSKQQCNTEPCPKWAEFPWSPCSVTCGQGYQTRNVICRDAKGHVNNKTCNPRLKPISTQTCITGIPCHKPKPDERDFVSSIVQPYPPPQAQRYTGTHIVTSEPSFVPDSWGQCSVTCGTGTRRRKVECKIFLEFSRTIAKLPDKECPGNKPPESERCVMKPCTMSQMDSSSNSIDDTRSKLSYSWKQTGFTPCSASCLGGVRETVIQCIRDHDQAIVTPYLCDISKKPDVITQTCNDQPCPPRWNVSEFSICSKSCGSGLQTRHVHCVHEVTRGGNTLVVPNNVCTQPPPRAQQFCNVIDCPPRWEPGPWSKCSKVCDGGVKTRKLLCQQVMALGQVVDKGPSHCQTSRPITSKSCNVQKCIENEAPKIYSNRQSYVQESPRARVSLKVGGKATLFRGTHLTVKCPVGKFNRSRIRWVKDRNTITYAGRIRVSRNGALRIRSLQDSDSGIYTCIAGRSRANITLNIKNGKYWRNSEESMSVDIPPNSVGNLPKSPMGKSKPTSSSNKYKNYERNWEHPSNYSSFLWPLLRSNVSMPRSPSPKYKPGLKEDINSIEVSKEPNVWGKKFFLSNPELSDQSGNKSTKTSQDEMQIDEHKSIPDKLRKLPTFPRFHALLGGYRNSEQSSRGVNTDGGSDSYEEKEEIVNLGPGPKENLEFAWLATNWSACSSACSGESYQVRAIQCVVSLNNNSRTIDNNLCVDTGMKLPDTKRLCVNEKCPPHWETGEWQECSESRCTAQNTAIQRRVIRCRLKNGTVIDSSLCNPKTKPRQRRKCYKEQCRATWRTGEWSTCSSTCSEETGFQSRSVQCVWFGTKKKAGSACRDLRSPDMVRPCRGPQSPRNNK